MKLLSAFLLLLGGGIYVNAFVEFWAIDPAFDGFAWTVLETFVGGVLIFSSYVAYRHARVRQYRATYPYRLSDERRQAIRASQHSISNSMPVDAENEERFDNTWLSRTRGN